MLGEAGLAAAPRLGVPWVPLLAGLGVAVPPGALPAPSCVLCCCREAAASAERCVWGRGLAGDNCLSPARATQGGFLLPGLSLLPEMLSRPGAGREAVPCQAAEADAFHL